MFRKTLFSIDPEGEVYEGYTTDRFWNGYQCPYFTKDVAIKISRDVTQDVTDSWHEVNKDEMHILFQDDADGEPEVYKGETIHVNGEEIHVYPIGNHVWAWQEVSSK